MQRRLAVSGLILGMWCSGLVFARDIYVDNMLGNDAFDGALDHPIDSGSGPVQSLRRAMHLVGAGDRVVLSRRGAVYYDSICLTGSRHSGTALYPFTLIGNGATLSGLRTVPPAGWYQTGPNLWKLTLTRKGYYRLLRGGRSLPERIREGSENPLESLAAGQWTSWQGSLYFRADGDSPATQSFSYAAEQTGLSLYKVANVRIVDVTFRDFRFDGVHAQNMCENVKLENVSCINNGRAGIAVSGTSHVDIAGGKSADNGRHQLLLSGKGSANIHELSMQGEPTVVP